MDKTKLSDKYKDKFSPVIITRGIEYFKTGEVEKLFKNNDEYIAKFYGHSSDYDYMVKIKEMDDELIMSCTCPYHDNCKHEYATLLAIDSSQYKEVKLKPEVESNICCLVDLIKNIPSDELKEYMIKRAENDLEDLSYDDIMDYFIKYQPKEKREYYYNYIYNKIVMYDIPIYAIDDISKNMRKYIAIKDYEQVFVMFSSTIDALTDAINDTNFEVCEDRLIEIYNKLIIYARISYRKCSIELKEKYNIWLKKYDDNNYYNDVYLEDVLLSIK